MHIIAGQPGSDLMSIHGTDERFGYLQEAWSFDRVPASECRQGS
jgi:hypothetical protein